MKTKAHSTRWVQSRFENAVRKGEAVLDEVTPIPMPSFCMGATYATEEDIRAYQSIMDITRSPRGAATWEIIRFVRWGYGHE